MLTYKAMYKFLEQGVHGEVLDFPGVISWGSVEICCVISVNRVVNWYEKEVNIPSGKIHSMVGAQPSLDIEKL